MNQTKFQLFYRNGSLYAQWEEVTDAIQYQVTIFDEDGKEIYQEKFNTGTYILPVKVSDNMFQPKEDQIYQGRLDVIFSSEFASCIIPSSKKLLEDLWNRLQYNRLEDGSYVFNDVTLTTLEGDTDLVTLMEQCLKLSNISLLTTEEPELDLTKDTLTMIGTSKELKNTTELKVKFNVSEDYDLQMEMVISCNDEWTYADVYPEFQDSVFQKICEKNVTLIITSYQHIYSLTPQIDELVLPGMNLYGYLVIPLILNESVHSLEACEVLYGGFIETNQEKVSFELENQSQAPELTLKLHGIEEQNLLVDKINLSSRRGKAYITTRLSFTGSEQAYELDLPMKGLEVITLNNLDQELCFNHFDSLLRLIGGESLEKYFPDSLLSMVPIYLDAFGAKFIPGEDERNSFFAKLKLPSITLLPSILTISESNINVSSNYYFIGDSLIQNFSCELEGIFQIGSSYEMQTKLYIPSDKVWELSFTRVQKTDILEALSEIIGFDFWSLLKGIPECFTNMLKIGLDELVICFNPFQENLDSIDFTIGSEEPWVLITDKLVIEHASFNGKVSIDENHDWSFVAYIQGDISFGEDNRIHVLIPFIPDSTKIEILFEGELSLPTLATFFDLVGIKNWENVMPKGFATMGDFVLTMFHICFDFSYTMSMDFVQFAMNTTSEWAILPDELLTMRSLETNFTYHADLGELTGFIRGIVELCGVDVAAEVKRMNTQEHWLFQINTNDIIHIPGISDLSSWLFPEQVETYLPEAFMPFPKGLDVTEAGLELDLSEQTTKEIQFTIQNTDTWHIIPDIFDFHYVVVKADLKQPFSTKPIDRFDILSVLYLGRNEILMKAHIASEATGEDTILIGKISKEKTFPYDITELSNKDGNTLDWGHLPLPDTFSIPLLNSIDIALNFTKNQYIVAADFESLGQGVFASMKVTTLEEDIKTDHWEYFVAVALDHDFTFGALCSELSVIDDYFKIESAGALISSFEDKSCLSIIESIPKQYAIIPKEGLVPENPLKKGAFVYGSVRLDTTMFGNILKLGTDTDPGLKIYASAYFPEDAMETRFSGSVNGFSILYLLQFSDITLNYFPKKANEFTLEGNLAIAVGETIYAFAGSMHMNDVKGVFHVETVQSMENPLGVPGLCFEKIALDIDATFGNEIDIPTKIQAKMLGQVGFGPKDEQGKYPINLEGDISIDDGELNVFAISLTEPLSVDSIFESIFGKDIWPKGLLDITFYTGILYYAIKDCEVYNVSYHAGFHLKSQIDVYGFSFLVKADFVEDKISVSGNALKMIDFVFAQLTDSNCTEGGPGVLVEVDDNDYKFGITGGLRLFGENFLSIPEMVYSIEKNKFYGKVCYIGAIEFLRQPISFSWSEKDGIRIENWPMDWISTALDYTKIFEAASLISAGDCGTLIGMIFKEVITTECSLNPSFGGLNEKGNVPLTLTLSYKISACKQEITTVSLNPLTLEIEMPESIGFEALAAMIIDTVIHNVENVFQWIISDIPTLTKFLMVVGLTSYAEKAAASLICRGLKDSVKGFSEASSTADIASASIAQGAGGVAAAGASAAASSSVGADAALAVTAGFFGVLAGIFSVGSTEKERAEEIHKKATTTDEETQRVVEEAKEHVEELLTIENLSLEVEHRTIHAKWKLISKDERDIQYRIKAVLVSSGATLLDAVSDKSNYDIPCSSMKPGLVDEVKVDVYAFINNVIESQKYHYEGNQLKEHVYLDTTFEGEAVYESEIINVKWDKIDVADSYQLLWKKDDEFIAEFYEIKETDYAIDLTKLEFEVESGVTYNFQVVVNSDKVHNTVSSKIQFNMPEAEARMESLITRIKKEGLGLLEGCDLITHQCPEITDLELAQYAKEIWTEVEVNTMSDVMMYYFGTIEDKVLHRGIELKLSGYDDVQTALELKKEYQDTTAEKMAEVIMKLFG